MTHPSEEHSAIAELFRHNLWANLHLVDSCMALTEPQLAETMPGTYGTVYDTILHFARSEEWYLSDLTGIPRPMPFEDGGHPNLAEIKAHLRLSGEGLVKAVGRIQWNDVSRWADTGKEESIQSVRLIVQIINHATEHRTQVTTVLSQLGLPPPDLSGWAYDSENNTTRNEPKEAQ